MSIETDLLVSNLRDQNATLTAEIKRLEAHNVELHNLAVAKCLETEKLRLRITLLEAALQLPEGCDPWDLKRAMSDGARTAGGTVLIFHKMADENSHLKGAAIFRDGAIEFYVDRKTGGFFPGGRLYCRKEAK